METWDQDYPRAILKVSPGPIPTGSHCCGYHNLGRHWPHKLCVLHLSSPREVSRGAKQCGMDPKTLWACAFSFGSHRPQFCTSWGAAHTICAVNGDQGCGSHNVATSWDWREPTGAVHQEIPDLPSIGCRGFKTSHSVYWPAGTGTVTQHCIANIYNAKLFTCFYGTFGGGVMVLSLSYSLY